MHPKPGAVVVRDYIVLVVTNQKMNLKKTKDYLDGTDGLQYSPELGKDAVIGTYMSDYFRNMYFEYRETDRSSYRHFALHTYGTCIRTFTCACFRSVFVSVSDP